MTGIGIAGCDGCGCLCCKRVWRSTYDCATGLWGTPTVISETSSQTCDPDIPWARVTDECYAETTIFTNPETCSGTPTPPTGPVLSAPTGCCCVDCCSDLLTWTTVSVALNFTGGTTDFDCPSVPSRDYQKNVGTVGTPSCSGDCDYCQVINGTYFLTSIACTGSSGQCPAVAGTCTLTGIDEEIYALAALCTLCNETQQTLNCCVSSPPFSFNSPMTVATSIRFSTRKHPDETYCRIVLEISGTIVTTGGIGVTCPTGEGYCAVFISDELSSNICCGDHTVLLKCKTGSYCDPFPSSLTVTISCPDPEGGDGL